MACPVDTVPYTDLGPVIQETFTLIFVFEKILKELLIKDNETGARDMLPAKTQIRLWD